MDVSSPLLYLDPSASPSTELLETLEKEGFKIVAVQNATQAQEQLQKEEPVMILAVVPSHEENQGLLLREKLGKNKIPFMLICADHDTETRLKGIQMNITHFATTPLNLKSLKTQIGSILSMKAEAERVQEEEKLQAIKQLSATMSHEIKNHLATILGNAELIQIKYPELGPDIEKKLQKIQKAGKSIKTVLDNLNQLTKLTTTMYVDKVEMLQIDTTQQD